MPRVIVVVEGGVVSGVFSDQPLNVDVLDHDNWNDTDPEERPRDWQYFAELLNEIEEGELQPQMY